MSQGPLTVAFLGNHSVSYSTESHVAVSLESLGHTVVRIQEGATSASEVPALVKGSDLFLHTQTRGLAITAGGEAERTVMYSHIRSFNIPLVGYHLDLFFGLDREDYVRDDPYFHHMDHFFSTDGGHDERWAELGINHHYLPPGVLHTEAYDGTPRAEFATDIAFVGSWKSYAHTEHAPTRRRMLRVLQRRYGQRFKCFPQGPAIRGTDLTDLYASVKVVVGDSCLAGQVRGYVSDRVTETTGRGGFLIHPYVPGILDILPNLVTYPAGDWTALIEKVDYYLGNDSDRELNRKQNAEHTRTHHTYARRMEEMLKVVLG